jgi:glycerophosphoryl diester phosphodiesterase
MDTSANSPTGSVIVVGHRGACGHAPENTLRSFATAMEMGCQRVEMDVHLSKDGVLMVIHDATLDRTTNGTGPVASRSCAELKRLDAGQGERIPTLEDVMEICRGRADLQIELKGPGVAGPVAECVRRNWDVARLVLTSFQLQQLDEAAPLLPGAALGLLNRDPALDMVALARDRGHQWICPRATIASPDLIAGAHAAGLRVYVYHVNTPQHAADAVRWGADAIGSDYPNLIFRQLAAR